MKTKIWIIILLSTIIMSTSFALWETYKIQDSNANEIWFFGNVWLNMCLPFNFSGSYENTACSVDASINDWEINLNWDKKYDIDVKYLWGYFWENGSNWFATRVTSEVKLGNNYYPVWDFSNPITSNVNAGWFEKQFTNIWNTSLSIVSQVWDMNQRYSNWNLIQCSKTDLYSDEKYEIWHDKYGRCYYRTLYYKIPSYSENKNNWYKYTKVEWDKDS